MVSTAALLNYPELPRKFHGAAARHFGALLVFTVVCILVGLWQVRRGMTPIEQLRRRLSEVREGRSGRLDGVYPSEVQPLVDDLNLLLIEQPLSEDDLWDHRQLQASLSTSICLDESILSSRHARQAPGAKALP